MKTYEKQLKEVWQQIDDGMPQEEVISREVIAEDDDRVLVRSVGAFQDRSKKWWPTCSYELWKDKDKFRRNIYSDIQNGQSCIYMIHISVSNERQLIYSFHHPQPCEVS